MIKVECPSCTAPYELDERRLPQNGLKMRCPKCGASFRVHPSGETGPADGPGAAPAPPRPRPAKKTMVGMAPPSTGPVAPPTQVPGVAGVAGNRPPAPTSPSKPKPPAPASPSKPKPPPPAVGPAAAGKVQGYRPSPPAAPPKLSEDPDLPAPKAPAKKPLAPPFGGAGDEVDLPAPKAQAKKPLAPPFGGVGDEVDLPAPKAPAKKPLAPAFGGLGDEVDLPAPKAQAKKPPAPAVPLGGGARAGTATQPQRRPLKPTEPEAALPEESFADLDVDLPMRKQDPPPGRGGGGIDIDLPVPKRPATPAASPSFDDLDADLPVPKGAAARSADLHVPGDDDFEASFADLELTGPHADVDLPTPKRSASGGIDELDLPMPKGGADLPVPKPSSGGGFGELDLPMPKGGADLPAPKRSSDGFGELDLPVGKGGADLPAAKQSGGGFGDLDLPIPKAGRDLPVPKSGGIDELDLPVSSSGRDLPTSRDATDASMEFGDLELPPPRRSAPPPGRSVPAPPGGDFDELELPEPPSRGGGGGADLDLPPARPQHVTADGRTGAGGVGFGEIDFGEESDDMEFGDLPEERPSGPGARAAAAASGAIGVADEVVDAGSTRGAVVDRIERPVEEPAPRPKPPRKGRGIIAAVAILVVLVLAGVGAGLFTPHGYFGVYALEQLLPEAGDPATVARVIDEAETTAASDTYEDLRASLSTLGQARRSAGLNRRLLARSLVHEALYQVRFGEDTASEGRAVRILQRLDSRGGEAPGMSLARAAWALAQGDAAQASSHVAGARSEAPADPYVHLVAGEAALAAGDPEQALEAFQQAVEHEGGARARWGLARALLQLDRDEEAAAAIDAALEASPQHAEAMIAKGRLALAAGEMDEAIALARRAAGARDADEATGRETGRETGQETGEETGQETAGEPVRTSKAVQADAWTLLGRVHESRGNRSSARQAYERALAADPYEVGALLGAGRVLLADGRHRDALTRFESVLQSGVTELPGELADDRPLQVEARLGAARAMLNIDRVTEAKTTLEQLAAAHTEDPEILLWLGKAEQELGDRAAAEQHFRESVRLAPERFDGYLALAQLFFQADRSADATAVLDEARERVEETAQVRRMLGETELQRNNLGPAMREFRRALELDPNELAARFGLGIAQRRDGKLGEASDSFAAVAEQDPSWPGLALERGIVFEAQGQSDRAVAMYEKALEERPDDPDLLLRLGAAQVAAGQIDEAEQILQRVVEARPNSAEAEHFIGRVAMARGDMEEAITHFSRAVSLDANRGEYWLYVGWTALEMGNLGRSLEAIGKALEHDPSLGDAYWIRGRVRVRTGAVEDARRDLERALELKPGRNEAYADLGDALDQLRRLPDAVRAYERAVDREPTRGRWWYRLGRLRMDAGNANGSRQALERAVALGDAADPRPVWLPDAHRLLGEAAELTGARAQAVQHFRRYLEIAPNSAIDREDVERRLERLTR